MALREDNLLERLLDPAIRLGASTPGADPGGDYATALFRRAKLLRDGAEAILLAKAMHLAGGLQPAPALACGHPIRPFLTSGTVDVFLCYRTTARDLEGDFDVVAPPPPLRVITEYRVVALAINLNQQRCAARFVATLLSANGQACLERHGFCRN